MRRNGRPSVGGDPGAEVDADPDGVITVVLAGELDRARVEDVADLLTTALRRSPCIRLTWRR